VNAENQVDEKILATVIVFELSIDRNHATVAGKILG
jgi:hypothetical protein